MFLESRSFFAGKTARDQVATSDLFKFVCFAMKFTCHRFDVRSQGPLIRHHQVSPVFDPIYQLLNTKIMIEIASVAIYLATNCQKFVLDTGLKSV